MGFAMTKQKTAFTLVEAILVVLFLGILAAIAIPRLSLSASSKQKANSLARKIVTDLRRTRRLAISNAATNPTGFTLRMTAPEPYLGYQIVDDSNSVVVDSQTIDSNVRCMGSSLLSFGPLGNLRSGPRSALFIVAEGRVYKISFVRSTGMVKCTEN